jgi:FkbM family methyltransferase
MWNGLMHAISGLLPTGTAVPILAGPLKGARWIAGAAAGSGKGMSVVLNRSEPEELARAAAWLGPSDVCFDLGANVGFYTLLFARRARRVVAFEPLPRNLAFLARAVEINRCRNVTIVPWAVSESSGLARFSPGDNSALGRLSADGEQPVATISLDEFVATYGLRPTFLKIDVEGAEASILRGSTKVLEELGPKILIEMHGLELVDECLALLRARGYTRIESVAPGVFAASK